MFMKQSSIWLSNIKKYSLFLILISLLNCKKEEYVNQPLIIEILSFKEVDKYNSYCTVIFKNRSNTNYILPTIGYVYLVKNKAGEISYEDVSKIEGKIVSSDFKNRVENLSESSLKLQEIINKYIDYTKNKVNLPNDYFDDFDRFSHAILFLPKNSESRVTIWFNAQNLNARTLEDEEKKVVLSNIHEKFEEKESKFLDSLSLKTNLTYQVYKNIPYLRDSLRIYQ